MKNKINVLIVASLIVIFLWGNSYIFSKLLQGKEIFNPYIFLLIININVVFFIILLAIVLRHLIKLFFELKSKNWNLRRKLSIILIVFIILPAIILSISSITIISNATNLWFSGKVENALGSLKDISKSSINTNVIFLEKVIFLIKSGKLTDEEAIKIFNLNGLAHIDKNGNIVKKVGDISISKINKNLKSYVIIYTEKDKGIIRYLKKLDNGYLVVDYPIPLKTIQNYKNLSEIQRIYSQFRYYKNPIRISYIMTMLIITLFVVLAALWFSRYIVRNITIPLEKLVEASKELASGNLSIRINTKAPDEIGILINEFNNMVSELKNLYIKLEISNRELKANKEYLEAILENARTGVIYSNKHGKVEKINKAASLILNLNPKDVEGKDIIQFLQTLGINTKIIDKEQTLNINGKIIVAKLTKISPKGYILVFDDITDIVEAEKIMTWKEIAKRIAHEIKNPLTPIKLSAERIKKQYLNNNPNFEKILDKSVSVIKNEVDYLAKLVKEFGQLAKTDKALNLEKINLKELLEEISNNYSSENFKVKVNCGEDIYIIGDRNLLKQAFSNLVQNSYESLEELQKEGEVNIEVKKDLNNLIITIKDNGSGISKKDIDKIFIPYYTNKAKGTGLGLTIVKEVIDKHKGKIKAIPSDEGAIFKITLPLVI